MDLCFGKSCPINIKVDNSDYIFYYYKNVCKIAGLILCLFKIEVPLSLDDLTSKFLKIEKEKLIPKILDNFQLLSRAYLDDRLGSGVTKIITQYPTKRFPVACFCIKDDATVYLLYNKEKLSMFFGTFILTYYLYTHNSNNFLKLDIARDFFEEWKNMDSKKNLLTNPYKEVKNLSKKFVDSIENNTTFLNSDNFKNTLNSLIRNTNIPQYNRLTAIKTKHDNNHCLLSELIETSDPHWVIASLLFNIFEAALHPVYIDMKAEHELYEKYLASLTKSSVNTKKAQHSLFEHNFYIQFDKASKTEIVW